MTPAALPAWVAVPVALLVVCGALLALLGSIGLLRLDGFYRRVHPPTMGTTLGVGLVLIASMLLFSSLESRPVVHELVITVFMIATTPVTFMLLVRAARHREKEHEGEPGTGRPEGRDARQPPANP